MLLQVGRQVGKSIRIDLKIRLLVAWVARLQIADTTQCSLPVLLQLRGNETILGIAGRVAPFGEASLVASLLHLKIHDTLLVFLLFLVHPFRLERGFDCYSFHGPEQLPPTAASILGPPKVIHRGKPIIRFGLSQRYTGRLCGLPVWRRSVAARIVRRS